MDTVLAEFMTLALVAAFSRLGKSWSMFAGGAVGTLIGLLLAPVMTMDWEHNATHLERIMALASFDLQGTIPCAAVGMLIGWLIGRKDPTLPTDDSGRR
jgi:hypothetical protein